MAGSELRSMVCSTQGVRVACALLAVLIASCNAFDRGKLMPPISGTGGTGGRPMDVDAGDTDSGVCVPTAEVCNGVDDDCDGVPDTQDEEAKTYCEGIVLNIEAGCLSTGGGEVVCARKTTVCNPGFANCDGSPANGCEHTGEVCRPCLDCEDDAGADEDAGF